MTAGIEGRDAELAAFAAVAGSGRELRVLNFVGEAGIGKTTVLRSVVAVSSSFQVHQCRSSPAETQLAFTGLADLLASVDKQQLSGLPAPQRRALEVALLRSDVEPTDGTVLPDPRTIGTALVSLLLTRLERNPVLLVIDDVQWLDLASARALEFALRRLEHCDLMVVTSERTGESGDWLRFTDAIPSERVQTFPVGPLAATALRGVARGILGRGLNGPLFRRIERASGGNPLYTAEVSRVILGQIESSRPLDVPVPDDLRGLVADRLRRLPKATRDALLRASAVSAPMVGTSDLAALAPAEEAGVIFIRDDGRVEFAHPLFANAVYVGASTLRRRKVHAELAATAATVEERALHLQRSAPSPDEGIAAVLIEAADAAIHRGAVDAAAELAMQSARFTPPDDTLLVAARTVRAARHVLSAGDPVKARSLCEQVLAGPSSTFDRIEALRVATEAIAVSDLRAGIPLLEAALVLSRDDPTRMAQLELSLGQLSLGLFELPSAKEHLRIALRSAEAVGVPGIEAEALALSALVDMLLGEGVDEQLLLRAVEHEDLDRVSILQTRPSLAVAMIYEYLGHLGTARSLLLTLCEALVARGAESELAYVYAHLGATAYLSGDLDTAERELNTSLHSATLAGQDLFRSYSLVILALVRSVRGVLEAARQDATEALQLAERVGWVTGIGQANWILGFIASTEGDDASAASLLGPLALAIEAGGVYEYPNATPVSDAIEALVAVGKLDDAARITRSFGEFGRRLDRSWALAVSGRCEALILAASGDLEAAERAAVRALADHERLPMPFELARTLLVLGQIQRRAGRTLDASGTIERAEGVFVAMGARPWADRAAAERRLIDGEGRSPLPVRSDTGPAWNGKDRRAVSGSAAAAPTTSVLELLPPSERAVALAAAAGRTNREIAAELHLSTKTVDHYLQRAFRRLGVRNRTELATTLAREVAPRRPDQGARRNEGSRAGGAIEH